MTGGLAERQRQALAEYQTLVASSPQLFPARNRRRLILDPTEIAAYAIEHKAVLGVAASNDYVLLLNDLVESRSGDGAVSRYPYMRIISRAQLRGGVNVVVLPVIADAAIGRIGDIVFVEQERHATGRAELELPRGFGEPGLDMAENALKELREETGYIGGDVRLLGSTLTDSGLLDIHVHFARLDIVGKQAAAPEPREAIFGIRLLSLSEVWASIAAGEIRDGYTLQAMALLGHPPAG